MNYLIRRAAPGDADALAPVAAQIFVETFAWENDPDVLADYVAFHMIPDQLRYEIEDAANRFFLVYASSAPEESGDIIAHVKMRFSRDAAPPCVPGEKPIELARFFVRSEWHGRGVAQQLMEFCVSQARAAGGDILWLDVFPTNERARRFYSRQGFTDIGKANFPLGPEIKPVVVMARSL